MDVFPRRISRRCEVGARAVWQRLVRERVAVITLATWRFEQDGHQRWRWKRMYGNQIQFQSDESFPDRMSCVLHAVRYVVRQRRK